MLVNILVGLALLGLILWYFEVVLSQRDIDADVKEIVG